MLVVGNFKTIRNTPISPLDGKNGQTLGKPSHKITRDGRISKWHPWCTLVKGFSYCHINNTEFLRELSRRSPLSVLNFPFQILHILALGVLAMILREPSLLRKLQSGSGDLSEEPPAPLPTPLSNVDTPNSYTNHRQPELIYRKFTMESYHLIGDR